MSAVTPTEKWATEAGGLLPHSLSPGAEVRLAARKPAGIFMFM